MKSLEVLLSESVSAMSEKQKNAFYAKRQKDMSLESLVSLAESCLTERGSIKRNNGGQGGYAESDPRAESDAILMEGLAKRDPLLAESWARDKATSASVASLSESQRKDFEFCRLLGMSEQDSLRSVKADRA